MKIGYPCLNYSLGCQANKTFRLASYTDERFIETAQNNLDCLQRILEFNVEHGLLFFRISSEIFPFASHQVLKVDWQKHFQDQLRDLGQFISKHQLRISMHPDQFVLINSPRPEVVVAGIKDLLWHCQLLDSLGLDETAKVQIHVGGVYGDRERAMKMFIDNYRQLPALITRRLVIENDDKCFSLADCLQIHEAVGIPIIFDNFHHECLNRGETLLDAIHVAAATWATKDGIMMTDFSSQQAGAIKGKHADSLDLAIFTKYLKLTQALDFDIMLEIKDKEKSAQQALAVMQQIR
jgi:UV DNA damage endonuclease